MLRRTHRSAAGAAALVALALVATACGPGGSGGRGGSDADPVAGEEVRVVDNAFEPEHLEVAAGDAVTWTWEGRAAHDVEGDGFASEVQDSGTFSHTFEEPGTYAYHCNLHGGMTGTVTVVDG